MEFQKGINVISKKLLILIILGNSLISIAQEKISGNYSFTDGTGEYYTNYSFIKNGVFTYEHGGDLGTIEYGKGHYFIKKDSLFLNFDLTQLTENSYHKYKCYINSNDSIQVKINIYDINKKPLSDILVDNSINKKKKTSEKDGVILFKFKKEKEKVVINISNFWYGFYFFTINANLNYEIDVYLKKSHDNPIGIKDVTFKYEIVDFKENHIKLKNIKGLIILEKSN